MSRRTVLLVAALVAAFLVAAGSAVAAKDGARGKPEHTKAPDHAGPPEHAKAHGHAKRDAEPPAAEPPAAAPPAAAAPSEAAAPPVVEPPAREDPIDARSDADAVAFGAGVTRVPSWASEPRSPPTSDAEDASRWWAALAWTLPVVGLGGIAAVLVARQRLRAPALATVERATRMSPVSPDDVRGLLQNGHVAAKRGALDEAIAWFERALAVSPTLGVAWFCKGVCLAANGRTADAYGALRSACTMEPAEASYRVHFARVALALGKHHEAMDALELVARAMPELGRAMIEDPQLASLRDHPRFLMICGEL